MARLRVILLLTAIAYALLSPLSAAHADETEPPQPTSTEAVLPPAEPPAEGPYIQITLKNTSEDVPVPGVTLTVFAEDDTEIGAAATDSAGVMIVPIPGNGVYRVVLDEDTLPDGVELSSQTKSEIEITARFTVNPGLFPIGVQDVVTTPFAERLSTSLVSGVKFGLLVALAALGLSLIFGTTGLTNFAHGDLITFGAITTYIVNQGVGLPVIWAGLVAVLVSALFGWAQDRGIWRPLRRRGTGLIAMMIVSIGLGLLLRNLFQYVIGSSRQSLSQYVSQTRHDFGVVKLADKEIAIIVVASVTIVVTCIVLMRTRLGKAMRAVSDNPALAASSGMQVDRVISSVWILGTGLTGLAGVLLAVNSQVNFLMGFKLLLLVFAGVTLGGLGTIWGALFGSMVIGLMVEVGPLFGVPSSIKEVGALVVLILVLLVRPQGILGRRERVG
ncbi:MAG: branched-chain amino acid ABC transporter permease [Nocardioides sp.]